MKQSLQIAFVTPELSPIAHTGSLSEISENLVMALNRQGQSICIFMPQYKSVTDSGLPITPYLDNLYVPILNYNRPFRLNQTLLHGQIPIFLIENHDLFYRDGIYGDHNGDFPDNAERFIFLNKAVLIALKAMNQSIPIIHCNDWESGLIPAYLKILYRNDPFFKETRTLFTVHNAAYQGLFWHFDMPLTGLPWDIFSPDGIEYYGKISFLKSGVIFADQVSTVSPYYARELQKENHGTGLAGVFRQASPKLVGIPLGLIPKSDHPLDSQHRNHLKSRIIQDYGLDSSPDIPLILMPGLTHEFKGADLVSSILERLAQEELNLLIVNPYPSLYDDVFRKMAQGHLDRIHYQVGYQPETMEMLLAGADIYFQAYRHEPYPYHLMKAIHYGTVPVAFQSGGAADILESSGPNDQTLPKGFLFSRFQPDDAWQAIHSAIDFFHRPQQWKSIIQSIIHEDFSWDKTAGDYRMIYNRLMNR